MLFLLVITLMYLNTFVFGADSKYSAPKNDPNYKHKIEPFSFNIQKFEYPLEYLKMGTTVALRDTIKIIPKVENRYGGIWMS